MPGESSATDRPFRPEDAGERLSAVAHGWLKIQLGVLGFIGICGVLRSTDSSAPKVVQVVAALLAVAALAVACVAIFSVGRVAYPIDVAGDHGTETHDLSHDRRRVRDGIRLTVLALILIVIATLSGWWPSKTTDPARVTLRDTTGHAWCGPMMSGPDGTVDIRTVSGDRAIT
jgi:uncharacterized membrane protein YedE/YeeE